MIRVNDPTGAKQAQELETIKPRTFVLNLSSADIERLQVFSDEAGITPEQLIESFIGDLIGGTRTNGGDERRQALMWYELVYLPISREEREATAERITAGLLKAGKEE